MNSAESKYFIKKKGEITKLLKDTDCEYNKCNKCQGLDKNEIKILL